MAFRSAVRDAFAGLLAPGVVNAAVAAGIAWLVVQPWGGLADKYPYYAPLGAVMSVSGTIVRTVRSTIQTVVAIAAGAVLGSGVLQLPLPEVARVIIVVGLGTWVANLRWLSGAGSWIAWGGIFILVIGKSSPLTYGTAYAGLTGLGAVIGVVVNALAPPLPLSASVAAVERLRSTLAEQFDDLADGLDSSELPTPEDWDRRRYDLEPLASQMQQNLNWASEARRVNWRARRWDRWWEQQYQRAQIFYEMYFLVVQLRDIVMTDVNAAQESVALGSALRPRTAELLRRMAALLRSSPEDADEMERTREEAEAALERLEEALRKDRQVTSEDYFTAGAVVTVLRRAIRSLRESPQLSRTDRH